MHEESTIKAYGPWKVCNYYQGSPTVCSSYSNSSNYLSYRDGSDNPHWREQIARGESATTNFDGVKIEVVRWGDGHAEIKRVPTPAAKFYDCKVDGILGAVYTFPDLGASQATALNVAKENLVRKARDFVTPLQMGVVMGELIKTLHMVRHPLLGLRRAMDLYLAKAMKLRRRGHSRARTDKDVAGAYLEATFGWEPLVADIEGGLNAVNLYFYHNPFEIKRFFGFGRDNQSSRVSTLWNGNSSINITSDWRLYDLQSARVRAGIKVRSEGSEAPWNKLQGLLGLKLRDFAPTAWELLPYSFLIDYFTNVGSMIDAASYVQGNVAWICYNSRRIQGRLLLGQTAKADSSFLNPYLEAISATKFHIRKKTVSRRAIGSIVPDFRLQLPGLATRKALNIGVLLVQRR